MQFFTRGFFSTYFTGIRGILTYALLGTLLASFIVLTAVNTYLHYVHIVEQDEAIGRELAAMAANIYADNAHQADAAERRIDDLNRIIATEPITAISVISDGGSQIVVDDGDGNSGSIATLLDIGKSLSGSEGPETHFINGRYYIASSGDGVGAGSVSVVIETPAREFRAIFFQILWDELPALLGIFAICAAVIPFIIGRAIAPIEVLTRASREIASGSFNVDIPIRRRDEIGILADTLRHMVRTIRNNMSRIHELAFVDTVSGLSNRAHFRAELEKAFTEGEPIALFFLDLDHFKKVNDTLGHDWGDRLLRAVAGRFTNAVDEHVREIQGLDGGGQNKTLADIAEPMKVVVSRLGGDEFAIALSGRLATTNVSKLAFNLLKTVEIPISVGGTSVVVGASIGVAVAPQDGDSASSLLKSADLAMYQAKRNGRGGVVLFEHELKRVAQNRLSLESDLRDALDRDQLTVFYQPKVDCRSGIPIGVEALARWNHPERGYISPELFISVAEESGLIMDLGRSILHKACRQAREWADAGMPVQVGVNVSMAQFKRGDFGDIVLEAIHETGISPAMLELEITESMAMDDPDDLSRKAEPLRNLGIKFSLDDFGTGYSSLGQLSALPFDIFKIDRSFITGMLDDQQARIIVRTILAMARSLNYKTVAEGVENHEQLSLLSKSGCGAAQGFLFSGPLPADKVALWMNRHRRPDIAVVHATSDEFAVDWAG